MEYVTTCVALITIYFIVIVFDADGRVDPDFLQAVGPYFRDDQTGGVQSAVRMYNANRNLITFCQHFEFVVWGEVFARAKDRLGSATLGGTCTRIGRRTPWPPFA